MRAKRTLLHVIAAAVAWNLALLGYSATRPRCHMPPSAVAIGVLRAYGEAQEAYRSRHGSYGTFEQLHDEVLLPDEFVQAESYRSYSYGSRVSSNGERYVIWAEPLDRPHWWTLNPDDWYFYMDTTREIRRSWSCPAGPECRRLGE